MSRAPEPPEKLILSAWVIAIVGLSKDETKPSNDVARYLISQGRTIIPVNPTADEILGLKCYPSLLAIPPEISRYIQIIDVFRKSEDIPPIAKEAIELRKRNDNNWPFLFWMQLGIRNEEAAKELESAGFKVVIDHCVKIEHSRWLMQSLQE